MFTLTAAKPPFIHCTSLSSYFGPVKNPLIFFLSLSLTFSYTFSYTFSCPLVSLAFFRFLLQINPFYPKAIEGFLSSPTLLPEIEGA